MRERIHVDGMPVHLVDTAGLRAPGDVVEEEGVRLLGTPFDAIVVYDFDNLKVTPVEILHDLPGNEWRRVQKAEGYKWTIVNGEVTFKDGVCTGATPGRLLRHGVAA